MNSLFQFEIPKRMSHCSHQGELLLPGMEIYSQVLEKDTQGFIRHDFCSVCWNRVKNEGEKSKSRGYWKSKIEQRKSSTHSSRNNRALALLRELQQASEPQETEIFVLSLFLSRARQIALRQEVQKEGVTYQIYEILREEEYLTVKALQLSFLEIETIQKSLAVQLIS